MKWKGYERKLRGPNVKSLLRDLPGSLRKSHEQPVKLDAILNDVSTGQLPNTSQKFYDCNQVAQSQNAEYGH